MAQDPTRASLTFVLPVYNGARFLANSLQRVQDWLEAQPRQTEFLVVDDGSSDATPTILAEFAAKVAGRPGPRFTPIRNLRNRGKGFSLRRAFLRAANDYVVFTDADLTYEPHNAESLLAALDAGADVAYGSRMHADSRYVVAPTFFPLLFQRHAMGRVFNLLVRAIVVKGIYDTQAGLKGFRRQAARDLATRIRLDRFSFDVELFYLARRLGHRIAECPVEFLYRKEPSTVKFAADSARMIRDMLVIRWRGLRGIYDRPPTPEAIAELEFDKAPAPAPAK